MGIPPSRMALVKTPFILIEGSSVPVKGILEIPVTSGTPHKCIYFKQTFMVIDMALTYLSNIKSLLQSTPVLSTKIPYLERSGHNKRK